MPDLLPLVEITSLLCLVYAAASTRLFRFADGPPNDARPRRVSSLDGLRGLLAFMVVFDHTDFWRGALLHGRWSPTDMVDREAGSIGVSMFFMITATLFFGKILDERSRIHWGRLYVGRVFRIAPVYLLAVGAMFLAVAIETRFTLRVPAVRLARELGTWLLLGIGPPDLPINGDTAAAGNIAGVAWSLRYEWLFYAALPVLALLTRWVPRARLAVVASVILLAMLGVAWVVPAREFPPSDAVAVLLFGVGAWSAILVTRLRGAVLPDRLASTIVAGAMLFILLRLHNTYTVQAVVPLGVAFFLIANGCTLFGLLTTRAARRVGDLSYPIYLTHGLVLAALMHVPRLEIATTHSTASYMGVRLLVAMLVLGVSGIVHVWVEKPGITLGRAVAERLSAVSHSGAVRARPLERAS